MEKKYELTDETMDFNGKTLYRIRALKDFGNVKKGNLGGYVESEKNLSHDGNCWIYDKAKVYGNANVFNDAKVFDNAQVFGNAKLFYNAKACGDAKVFNYARIGGDALIKSSRDFSLVSSFGSENRTSTFFRCDDGKVRVSCGCFYGTIHQFEKKVRKTHKRNQFAKEYLLVAKLMKRRFKDVK